MPFFYDFEKVPGRTRLDVPRTAAGLIRLRDLLDRDPRNGIPPKSVFDRLLIASWNIRHLGSAKRLEESYWYMAEILSRFDLVAVQEVRRDLSGLDKLRDLLGPWWKYLVTDVTEGAAGNNERLAFLFDSRKLRFGGLAGEIVLPPVRDEAGNVRPATQIVRTPYIAGFKSGWFDFMISTVHLLYGAGRSGHPPRVREVEELTAFLAARVKERGAWSRNLVLLGDFNIFDADSPAHKAILKAGFTLPERIQALPPTNVGKEPRFYDQIAFLFGDKRKLEPTAAGVVDYYQAVFRDEEMGEYAPAMGRIFANKATDRERRTYYRGWRSRQMSDHLVLWVELPIEFAQEYLEARRRG